MMVLAEERQKTVTEAQLTALGADAGAEVIYGEVVPMALAGGVHGKTSMGIGTTLFHYVRSKALGEVFADQTTYVLEGEPGDIRLMRVPSGYFYQAPDLAVEIVSPHDRAGDILSRVTDYLRAGARAVWVVYPETQQVMVHTAESVVTLSAEDTLEGGGVLPGFAVEVKALF